MKGIAVIIFLLLILTISADAGIVNNSGSLSADSLAIPFTVLDSTGTQTALTSGDSVFLVVFYPNGAKAFEDSGAFNDNNITSFSRHGLSWYAYKDAVANIDGSGLDGVYAYTLTVKDLTSSDLTSSFNGQFQLYKSRDFNLTLDYIKDILDTLQDGSSGIDVNLGTIAIDVADTLYNRDSSVFSNDYWHKIALRSDSGNVATLGGAYACQFMAYDTANSQVVPSASVVIRNLDQTSVIALGKSNISGVAKFNLDPDSFLVSYFSPGYIFSAYDTVVISNNTIDTTFGYQFDPGSPTNGSLCRIWGYLYGVSGIPETDAEITASLPQGVVKFGNTIISPFTVETTSDEIGFFYLDLLPSGGMDPDTTKYEITISLKNGTILRQRLTVPDLTSWQLSW